MQLCNILFAMALAKIVLAITFSKIKLTIYLGLKQNYIPKMHENLSGWPILIGHSKFSTNFTFYKF